MRETAQRPRLVLGTAQLGMAYGVAGRGAAPPAGEVEAILSAAVERGLRTLDTAPDYGEAERRIGEFVRGRPGVELEIGTKLSPIPDAVSGPEIAAIVAAAVEGSLGRLGIERIDRYLLHRPADLQRHGRPLLDALAREVEAGRILRCGVSVYEPAETAPALEHPELRVVQHPLNLLDRRLVAGGWLRRLQRAGIEVEARSVFLQGLLTLGSRDLPGHMTYAAPALAALEGFLEEHGLTPREAALAFVAASGVDRIVLGVDSVEQLVANIEDAGRALPKGLARRLAALPAVPESVFDPRSWPGEER